MHNCLNCRHKKINLTFVPQTWITFHLFSTFNYIDRVFNALWPCMLILYACLIIWHRFILFLPDVGPQVLIFNLFLLAAGPGHKICLFLQIVGTGGAKISMFLPGVDQWGQRFCVFHQMLEQEVTSFVCFSLMFNKELTYFFCLTLIFTIWHKLWMFHISSVFPRDRNIYIYNCYYY